MIEAGSKTYWRAVWALCLGSAMIFANLYVTQPLLPMLATHFELTPLQVGWSFTITTLTLGGSLLVYGVLSDAWGRRRLMLSSMAAAAFITLLLPWVQDYSQLLILRALQGICLAGLPAIAIAYMSDEFSADALRSAIGLYVAANTLGGVSGRLLGGFVGDTWDWHYVFAIMAVVSVIVVVLFARWLPPSQNFQPHSAHPKAMWREVRGHLQNPLLLVVYLMGGTGFMVFITEYSYITFVLAEAPYNLSPTLLGMLFLTYLTGTFASSLSGTITRYISPTVCMMFGYALNAVGSAITLLGDLWLIVLGFFINSFGFFLAHSLLMGWVSRHAIRARASASSLYLVFYYMGASLGGLYLEPFWLWQGWSGVVIGVWLALGVVIMGAVYLHRTPGRSAC